VAGLFRWSVAAAGGQRPEREVAGASHRTGAPRRDMDGAAGYRRGLRRPGRRGQGQERPSVSPKRQKTGPYMGSQRRSSSSAATDGPSLFLFLWRAGVSLPSPRNIAATNCRIYLKHSISRNCSNQIISRHRSRMLKSISRCNIQHTHAGLLAALPQPGLSNLVHTRSPNEFIFHLLFVQFIMHIFPIC
jgi:hypothetical protein